MSEEERLAILKWVEGVPNAYNVRELRHSRWDYILSIVDKTIPIEIWKIKKRIIEKEGLHEYRQEPAEKDLIVVVNNGGKIQPHTDLNSLDGDIHCRFNVFLNVSEEIETYYADYLVQAKNRHYVMCRSGIDTHWSSINKGDDRISLSFGFMLPIKKVDEIYILPPNVKKINSGMIPPFCCRTGLCSIYSKYYTLKSGY